MKNDRDIPTVWELYVGKNYVGEAHAGVQAQTEAQAASRANPTKPVTVWIDRQGKRSKVGVWLNGVRQ